MANLYGVNYTKSEINVPKDIIDHAEVNGRVLSAYDEITLAADLADADVVYLSKIPAGARVKRVTIVSPSLGTTGAVNIGTLNDATAFASAVALSGGAVATDFPSLEKFSTEEQLILTCTAATDAGTGSTIQVSVEFTVA